jgi:hypothetical protein
MAIKKALTKQEPLLSTVARKLGQAAGTLTKVTQEFTENLSDLPNAVTAKMQEIANAATFAEHSRTRPRRAKKRIRRTAPAAAVKKNPVRGSKGKPRRSKLTRSNRKSSRRRRPA